MASQLSAARTTNASINSAPAMKAGKLSGFRGRRDDVDLRRKMPLPCIQSAAGSTTRVGEGHHLAGLRDKLSVTDFRYGGMAEGCEAELTDARIRAARRPRHSGMLLTYVKPNRNQLIDCALKRRADRSGER